MLDLTEEKWDLGLHIPLLFYLNIGRISNDSFNKYFKERLYCDCKGQVYKVIERREPHAHWRNLLFFFPGAYKAELVLMRTQTKMELEQVRTFVLERIKDSGMDETSAEWLTQIKKAKTIKELLSK